jgi:hypothetical protein
LVCACIVVVEAPDTLKSKAWFANVNNVTIKLCTGDTASGRFLAKIAMFVSRHSIVSTKS